jgi:hypothetical protein
MKKIIVILTGVLIAGATAFGQGTVNFVNLSSNPPLNAPDFLNDGVTKLLGSTYTAVLFAGPNAGSLSLIASTPYLTGGGAGYFNGGTEGIGTVADGGTAFIQIYAYLTADGSLANAMADGASAANQWGSSSIFSVTSGDPSAAPPGTPAVLVGLTSFNLNSVVPEPATLALMGLGGASLLLFRRRKA